MRDLANNIGAVAAIAPASHSATQTSDAIDLIGFESAAAVIQTGAITSAGDFTPKLQESEDGETFTDAAAEYLVGDFPATLEANSVVKVGYIGHRRYIRTVLTKNGGTSVTAGVLIVKGDPHERPVA